MEREACVVCDHGFERSDLCAEIITNNNNNYVNRGTVRTKFVAREYVILVPRGKGKLKFCELTCLHGALLLKERSERI